jgi:hypothetical protein
MNSLSDSTKRLVAILAFGAALAAGCSDDAPDSQDFNSTMTGDGGPQFPGAAGGATGGPTGGLGGTGVAGGAFGGAFGGTTGGIAGTTGGLGGTTGSVGGPAGGGTTGGGAGNLPCAVKQIIDAKCGTCHKNPPAFSAPMPLVTLADFQAAGKTDPTKKAYELVKARINRMGTGAMPPPPTTMTAAELQMLNGWLDGGARAGTEASCTATPGGGTTGGGMTGPVDKTGLQCYKFVAHAQGSKTAKYKVGAARDQYIAMGFKAPWTGLVYGQVISPVVDNTDAIHHWLLYEEAASDGSISTSIGQHATGELLAGWAPGGEIFDFRMHGDVGIELPASSYVLELHYNSSNPSAEDASGAEVCVKTSKPQYVAAQSWLGWDQLLLPATSWEGTCDPGHSQPIHLLFLTPHLHQTGRHLKAVINGGAGGSRVLHDKAFDFAYQVTYPTKEVLMPGESITTTCTFSEPKAFGQATTEEMCYLFTYYYPAGTLVDLGPWGTLAHGEGVCLGQ